MSKKAKVWIDQASVRECILNSDEVLAECEKVAKEQAQIKYGNDYHMKVFKGTQRAHAIAYPNTKRNPE